MNRVQEISSRVSAVSDVRSVSFSSFDLLSGTRSTTKVCLGDTIVQSHTLNVSPEFFSTMGIPVLVGRPFGARDTRVAPHTAVVNETFAKRYLNDAATLGTTLHLIPPSDQATCADPGNAVEIVGIVADTKYDNIRETPPPTIFLSYLQGDDASAGFQVATRGAPLAAVPFIRRAIAELDPTLTMVEIRPQATYTKIFLMPETLMATLLTTVAVIALFLSCVGMYGTTSYAVSRRISEIGLRIALGAEHAKVVRMVLFDCAAALGLGLLSGLLGALTLTRYLESILYEVKPIDAASIIGATLFLLVSTVIAAWIPAHRATRIDPLRALRYE
jgi:ABC-type antimicrobial peptide transport system permease subunit